MSENNEETTSEKDINDEEQEESMSSFNHSGRKYYTTKTEALKARRANDRIYYDAYLRAYYIVRPKKRSFWRF